MWTWRCRLLSRGNPALTHQISKHTNDLSTYQRFLFHYKELLYKFDEMRHSCHCGFSVFYRHGLLLSSIAFYCTSVQLKWPCNIPNVHVIHFMNFIWTHQTKYPKRQYIVYERAIQLYKPLYSESMSFARRWIYTNCGTLNDILKNDRVIKDQVW